MARNVTVPTAHIPSQANAIYQAKQKLESIACAHNGPVNAEDLIRYAHRISSTNAVSAPLSWQQGDPRRPYPTGESHWRAHLRNTPCTP